MSRYWNIYKLFDLPFVSHKDAMELQQVKNIKSLNQQTVHPFFIFINFPNFYDFSFKAETNFFLKEFISFNFDNLCSYNLEQFSPP